MGNNCNVTIRVSGPKDELDRFQETAKNGGQEFSIRKFIPIPDGMKDAYRFPQPDGQA